MWSLEWLGFCRECIIITSTDAEFLWVINYFVILSCKWGAQGSVVSLICVFCVCILEVGSPASEARSWILFGHDFIDCWCFWGIEFSSAIALGSFAAHTKSTDIFQTVFHRSPLHTPVSHYTLPQFSGVQAIHHSLKFQTLCWNLRHAQSGC